MPVPRITSYPSDYAATAATAAAVMAYLVPAEAAYFQSLAEEAGKSRLFAGVEHPSDYFAGQELGRRVAEQVIAKARADGSDAVWTGSVPAGRCQWTGANPGNVTAAGWRPLLLTSPPEILEDRFDLNPPLAARAYALLGAVGHDAFIASQDGKFAYWHPRPAQLDPSIAPLFPAPNFPSYPSNHSTFSTAPRGGSRSPVPGPGRCHPGPGQGGRRLAHLGGNSLGNGQSGRRDAGKSVARKFIAWAENDGSRR